MRHEDDRRILTSIPYQDGELKIIIAKRDCELGNHYHKEKTETFQLLAGSGSALIKGGEYTLFRGQQMVVRPGEFHAFHLKKNAVLTCIVDRPYDKNDDYEH